MMAIEVMSRYEYKYLTDRETFYKFEKGIADFTELDPYNKNKPFYTICNLYYDTDDNNLIRQSLNKPVYKEKLRVRGYDIPGPDTGVYVEIKKKFNGLVNKRRTMMRLAEAYEFLETKKAPELRSYMNKQVVGELEYFVNVSNPIPKVYIAYDRRAYFGEKNSDLRITFDVNIRSRRRNVGLENGSGGEPLLGDDAVLIEIKASEKMPLWLSKLNAECGLRKNSFSKYGTEFHMYLADKLKEEKRCSNQFLTAPALSLLSSALKA